MLTVFKIPYGFRKIAKTEKKPQSCISAGKEDDQRFSLSHRSTGTPTYGPNASITNDFRWGYLNEYLTYSRI